MKSIRRRLSGLLAALRRLLQRSTARLPAEYRRLTVRRPGRWLNFRGSDAAARRLRARAPRSELDYSIYLPAGFQRRDALPLLVMLHGCQQDAALFAAGTRMNLLADRERFVVLYPEQRRAANAYRCWNWFHGSSGGNASEAGKIAQLTRMIIERYRLDDRRVYLAGMSAGGAMACSVAIQHGRLFAGAAIHSGLMHAAASSAMQGVAAMRSGSRASPVTTAQQALQTAGPEIAYVPALIIQGDEDKVVHPNNAELIVQQWQCLAQSINAVPLVAAPRQSRQEGGREVSQQDYQHAGRTVLQRLLIHGLGHAWSGGDARHPFNDAAGPDASELLWAFVSRHRSNASPAPFSQELPAA